MVLLGRTGIVNSALLSIGLISDPIKFLYNMNGVILAMVHILLPFMVLSITPVLSRIDRSTIEAAQNLGAGRFRVFRTVLFPLSMPGIIGGSSLVLCLSVAFFATPSLIGGATVKVLATLIYSQIMDYFNWPLASAMAVVTVLIVLTITISLAKILQYKYKGVFK
jgi:putative spermidine/putrescine transport system permease protein